LHESASSKWPGTSIHGAACAEIIYDIAPAATYYFAIFAGEVEFGNAVDWMIEQDVDIISCSISWPAKGPGDGTGPIDQIIDRLTMAGILWVQCAGNYANKHWSGPWINTNSNQYLDFKTLPSIDEGNTIWLNSGETIDCILNWNDPWGASSNDYDLLLFNASNNIVKESLGVQDGNDNPYEFYPLRQLIPVTISSQ